METGFHAKTANIFTQPPTGAATVQAYDDGKIELQSPDGKAKLKSWTSATLKPYTAETIGPFRCFVWVVLRLGNGWNGQDKFAGPVVGGGSEVDEVFESSSHSL